MKSRVPRTDPYVAFKDDQERRKALLVREIRIILTALFGTVASWPLAHVFLVRFMPF